MTRSRSKSKPISTKRKTKRSILSALLWTSGIPAAYVAKRAGCSLGHLQSVAALTQTPSPRLLETLAELFDICNNPETLIECVSSDDLAASVRAFLALR